MRSSIGNFIALDRSVPVTFRDDGFIHKRLVKAVLKADGTYDKAATKERVAQVAAGVERKRAAGALDKPPG